MRWRGLARAPYLRRVSGILVLPLVKCKLSEQHPFAQQFEGAAPVHLPFDELQAVHRPFGGSTAMFAGTGSLERGSFLLEPEEEASRSSSTLSAGSLGNICSKTCSRVIPYFISYLTALHVKSGKTESSGHPLFSVTVSLALSSFGSGLMNLPSKPNGLSTDSITVCLTTISPSSSETLR